MKSRDVNPPSPLRERKKERKTREREREKKKEREMKEREKKRSRDTLMMLSYDVSWLENAGRHTAAT